MAAEMSVPETDLELVRPGNSVALKLNAFPTATFHGTRRTHRRANPRRRRRAIFPRPRRLRESPGHAPATAWSDARAGFTPAADGSNSGWYPVGYTLFRRSVPLALGESLELVAMNRSQLDAGPMHDHMDSS